jgi:hypothetical protein
VSFLSHQGHVDRAVEAFRRAEAAWPLLGDAGQLEMARDYLCTEKSRAIARTQRTAVMSLPRRALNKAKSVWNKRFG